MARVAKRVSIDFLKQKVDALIRHDDGQGGYTDDVPLREAIESDLKVRFDFENFDYSYRPDWNGGTLLGYCTLGNGLTFLGCIAGGDWEYPVWFCVYWDGKRLRAYIPGDGNPYCSKTKQAYGNGYEGKGLKAEQDDFARKYPAAAELAMTQGQDEWEPADYAERDYGRILADVMGRIEVRD